MRSQPLKCSVEGDELVIRVGIDVLKQAISHCELFFDDDKHFGPPYVKITDENKFIESICTMLNNSDYDNGSTPVYELLDNAGFDAYMNGEEGMEEVINK